MSPSRIADAFSVMTRALAVAAGLAVLCNIDVFYQDAPAQAEFTAELTGSGANEVVDQPTARAISSFIRRRYKTSQAVADESASAALQSARETGLPVTLILAVAAIESSYKPHSDNGSDKGIMQVNPRWHPKKVAAIGGPHKLFNVSLGMKTGSQILKEYWVRSKRDMVATLLRYNGATKHNAYPGKVLAEKRRFDKALYSTRSVDV